GDRPAERHAEDRGPFEAKLVDQPREVAGVLANRLRLMGAEGVTIASETIEDHLVPTGQAPRQGRQQPPTTREAGHQDAGLTITDPNALRPLTVKENLSRLLKLRPEYPGSPGTPFRGQAHQLIPCSVAHRGSPPSSARTHQ